MTALFGSDAITAAATTSSGATGVARVSVVGDLVGGTTLLDVTDPAGDDNGPGTYQYPTSADFQPAPSTSPGSRCSSRATRSSSARPCANLVETFGSPDGAQLLDVYIHQPGAAPTSTEAAFASRNYTIAPADAWSQRLEVQGFAGPVWQDADGDQVGTVSGVVASPAADTITIALPAAQLGTPASGWTFSVVLTGQDGFSPDQARGFAPTPQPFAFGVCAAGDPSPICSVAPDTVPKAMDVITPDGVSQATELDPTRAAGGERRAGAVVGWAAPA